MPRDPYEADSYPWPRRGRTPTSPGTYLVALLIGFTVGGLLLWAIGGFLSRGVDRPLTDPTAVERPPAPKTPLDAEETEAVNLFKGAKPSVVNVDTLVRRQNWDLRVLEQQTGTGSGFVWDKQGRVVTNFHVVRGAAQQGGALRVVMADGKKYDAQVVGVAPDQDLAVLKVLGVKEGDLQPIRVGASKDLLVGQKAYAIGNPFGLSLTMTNGIISALDRTIDSPAGTPIQGAIQTSAAINPGNSGGPLLDKDGRLIGVNTSITSPSGGNVGIGFAIPVDTVNDVVTTLIREGKLLSPDLGVKLFDERKLRRAGFARGVMIEAVTPGGPAARAGLAGIQVDPRTGDGEPGDLITAVNSTPTPDTATFKRVVAGLKVNQVVTVHAQKGDAERDVDVTVGGV